MHVAPGLIENKLGAERLPFVGADPDLRLVSQNGQHRLEPIPLVMPAELPLLRLSRVQIEERIEMSATPLRHHSRFSGSPHAPPEARIVAAPYRLIAVPDLEHRSHAADEMTPQSLDE